MSREQVLAALGIDVFRLRSHPAPEPEPGSELAPEPAPDAGLAPTPVPPPLTDLEHADWDTLAAAVSACTRCALHQTRTQTVFGTGARDADLLVIGEAPGADEDRQGEPFVGRAGQLLNAMLAAIGLARNTVYIANILKCRPPGNRDPNPEETLCCTPYLERQIALLRPRAVLAVGRIAAQHLLQSDQPIGRLRGRILDFGAGKTPVVATYHPAYLLRSPQAKSKAWQDLCLVRRLISEEQ